MIKKGLIAKLIAAEEQRQRETLMLIPSENIMSAAAREPLASVLSHKYAEGYPGRRYYEGNEFVDQIETYCQDLAKEVYGVPCANVQPYSGSPANTAILMALAEPGDPIMGLALSSGGHLTHGHPKVTFSGKYYRPVQFTVDPTTGRIDMDEARRLARAEKPKVLIIGTTAYPFNLDWAAWRQLADEVGAWLVADVSHLSGLIAGKALPSPVPYAHVVMLTTHKSLRGPRGAMILVTQTGLDRDADLGKKIDSAIIPGTQGGPHLNTIASLAIALEEASTKRFVQYAQRVLANAQALAAALQAEGLPLVGGGTENHLMIIDRRTWGGGTQLAYAMAQAGLVANRNTVPGEPLSPFTPSGVRLGTPAITTQGLKPADMKKIARWIREIDDELKDRFAITPAMKPAERRAVIKAAAAWSDNNPLLRRIQQGVRTVLLG